MSSKFRSRSRNRQSPNRPKSDRRRSSSASQSNTSSNSGDLFEETKAKKYRLKVTAGTEYDPTTHRCVPVNGEQTVRIDNELATVCLSVRIRDYNGYPDNSPTTHPIFTHPTHTTDQYALTFSIIFKHPVNGNDLLFGNDFDRPIRNRLPPGFNTALRMVKWSIDPAMDGDAYADKPYLFSPALASWNQLRIGGRVSGRASEVPRMGEFVVEEGAEHADGGGGGDEDGGRVRKRYGIPGDASARMKFFQNEEERKKFVFEKGRVYWVNFGNPYLAFNDFSLHLPGFSLHAIKYVDEKNHDLRYVLKNRHTNEVYFVVLFTLVLIGTDEEPGHKEQIERDTQVTRGKDGDLGTLDWDVD